jgi:glycosyltransferase involved in cell wall biosynthesis
MSPKIPGISAVIPLYNEEENVPLLLERLVPVLGSLTDDWEIILVNDGSTDRTQTVLEQYAVEEPRIRVIELRRNYGQTAALAAGIHHASKELVVTLDGDLQNDPADIPRMVDELLRGKYDVVHGWRRHRQDSFLLRSLPSRIANWLIRKVTQVPVHDLGCSLRVMRREIAQELELCGQMHRFVAVLAHWRGARSTEIITRHHPRRFGQSKYGLKRTIGVFLDLLTVKFILDYFSSPMRFFGRVGIGCILVSLLAGVGTLSMKIVQAVDMTGNPLLLLSVFSFMIGIQFMSLGLLAELCVRVYYTSKGGEIFPIRKCINLPEAQPGQETVLTKRFPPSRDVSEVRPAHSYPAAPYPAPHFPLPASREIDPSCDLALQSQANEETRKCKAA